MNRDILGRNLLILHELEELGGRLAERRIPAVLLKGAALIACVPGYCGERMMEDIDLLLRPGDIPAARELFAAMGYLPAPEDPWAFRYPGKTAPLDIIDGLWYLGRRENRELFEACLARPAPSLPSLYRLPGDEFYVHVLAHAAVHHAKKEAAWLRDLELIKMKWGNEISEGDLDKKLRKRGLYGIYKVFAAGEEAGTLSGRCYLRLLRHPSPLKGHIARFVFLPLRRKLPYLLAALFPTADFIKYRYGLAGRAHVLLYRLLRPFILLAKLAAFLIRQSSVKSGRHTSTASRL